MAANFNLKQTQPREDKVVLMVTDVEDILPVVMATATKEDR